MVDPFSSMQSDASSGIPEIEREIIRESDRRIKASSLDIMPKSFYRETEREKNFKKKKSFGYWVFFLIFSFLESCEIDESRFERERERERER